MMMGELVDETTIKPVKQPKVERVKLLKAPGFMPNLWVNLIDNVWEDGDFDAGLDSLESLVGYSYLPSPPHIHQLLALSLSPLSCLPPRPSTPPANASTKRLLAIPTSQFAPRPSDPLLPTANRVRLRALALLRDFSRTHGIDVLSVAIPSHAAEVPLRHGLPKRYVKVTGEDLRADLHDGHLGIAGKRVGRCKDLWSLLGGSARREEEGKRESTRESPVIAKGWEVLEMILEGWEREANESKDKVSMSFLSQFAKPSYGSRKVSDDFLDIIFWPFLDLAGESSDEEEEIVEDDPVDEDEMTMGEKKRIAAKLVTLVGQLAMVNLLDLDDVMGKMTRRLRSLPVQGFGSFIDSFPITSPFFALRLATLYLESYSHSLSTQIFSADSSSSRLPPITPSKSSSALTLAPPSASPSRATRLLGATSSSQSLSSTSVHAHAGLPTEKSTLDLLRRVCREIPLPSAVDPQCRMTWDELAPFLLRYRTMKELVLNAIVEIAAGHGNEGDKLMRRLLGDEGSARSVLEAIETGVRDIKERMKREEDDDGDMDEGEE